MTTETLDAGNPAVAWATYSGLVALHLRNSLNADPDLFAKPVRDYASNLAGAVRRLTSCTADMIPAWSAEVALAAMLYARGYGIGDPALNPAITAESAAGILTFWREMLERGTA